MFKRTRFVHVVNVRRRVEWSRMKEESVTKPFEVSSCEDELFGRTGLVEEEEEEEVSDTKRILRFGWQMDRYLNSSPVSLDVRILSKVEARIETIGGK